jgi:hypothetical protein
VLTIRRGRKDAMKPSLVALLATLALAFQQPAAATASKCSAGEIGAAGKKAAAKVQCWAKATTKGVPVAPRA